MKVKTKEPPERRSANDHFCCFFTVRITLRNGYPCRLLRPLIPHIPDWLWKEMMQQVAGQSRCSISLISFLKNYHLEVEAAVAAS